MTKKYEFYKRNTIENDVTFHDSMRPVFKPVSEEEITQAENIL